MLNEVERLEAELANTRAYLSALNAGVGFLHAELVEAQDALREIATLENIGAVRAARRTVGAGTLSNRLDVLLNQLRRARPDVGDTIDHRNTVEATDDLVWEGSE
jgi:hypothetical protein